MNSTFDLGDCMEALEFWDFDDLVDGFHDEITQKIADGGDAAGDIDDNDIDCPDTTPTDPPFCSIDSDITDAVADALAEAIIGLERDCDNLGEIARNAARTASESRAIAEEFSEAINNQCGGGGLPGAPPMGIASVGVTCEDPGEFDLSFLLAQESDQIEVQCVGETGDGETDALPDVVEISPALGSVSYSLIAVRLLDDEGESIQGSTGHVDFQTDRCEFWDEDDLSHDDFLDVVDAFINYDPNEPDSAEDVHDAVEGLGSGNDPDDDSNDVDSFALTASINLSDTGGFKDFDQDDTIAAIILDCTDENIDPGIATVTWQVDQDGKDVTGEVEVTVVGPPTAITVEASPSSGLLCDEKSTIVAKVWDAAGQPVSDHTRVEAVTNFGGVLGGTGAVAGQAGLVVPVASTVGEAFDGTSTFFLLTSSAHEGPYEVVIASGGEGSVSTALGGVFSTPPAVTQVTVTCEGPAPPPPITAPDTGAGITPPSTGDAGLADRSGASATLFAVIGVVAFMVAGLATLKFARR